MVSAGLEKLLSTHTENNYVTKDFRRKSFFCDVKLTESMSNNVVCPLTCISLCPNSSKRSCHHMTCSALKCLCSRFF